MVREAFTKFGLLVKNKSRRRSSLVGSLYIWLRSKSWLRPNTLSLISLAEELGSKVPVSQSMSPALKSPPGI